MAAGLANLRLAATAWEPVWQRERQADWDGSNRRADHAREL